MISPTDGNKINDGMVHLDFRVTPNIYPKCKHGYRLIPGQKEVEATSIRLATTCRIKKKNFCVAFADFFIHVRLTSV